MVPSGTVQNRQKLELDNEAKRLKIEQDRYKFEKQKQADVRDDDLRQWGSVLEQKKNEDLKDWAQELQERKDQAMRDIDVFVRDKKKLCKDNTAECNRMKAELVSKLSLAEKQLGVATSRAEAAAVEIRTKAETDAASTKAAAEASGEAIKSAATEEAQRIIERAYVSLGKRVAEGEVTRPSAVRGGKTPRSIASKVEPGEVVFPQGLVSSLGGTHGATAIRSSSAQPVGVVRGSQPTVPVVAQGPRVSSRLGHKLTSAAVAEALRQSLNKLVPCPLGTTRDEGRVNDPRVQDLFVYS